MLTSQLRSWPHCLERHTETETTVTHHLEGAGEEREGREGRGGRRGRGGREE